MILWEDTIDDAASLDVSALGEVELDELSKATGVVVVHRLCIPKRLHDGTDGTNHSKHDSECIAR